MTKYSVLFLMVIKKRKDYKARFTTKFIIRFYKQNLLSKINLLLHSLDVFVLLFVLLFLCS